MLKEASTRSDELVGIAEIAGMLGVSRSAARAYSVRPLSGLGPMPEPLAVLAMGKVWRRADIEAWAAKRK